MFKFVVLAALLVAVNASAPGVDLFSGFLAANPEIKAQFPKFKNVANADLATNADLIAHAGKIYDIVSPLLTKENWDDIDALSVQHKALGQTNKAYFQAFRQYFLDNSNFDAEKAAKWNAALDKFFEHFYSAF